VDEQNKRLQHTTTIYLNDQIAMYAKELTDRLPGDLKVRPCGTFAAGSPCMSPRRPEQRRAAGMPACGRVRWRPVRGAAPPGRAVLQSAAAGQTTAHSASSICSLLCASASGALRRVKSPR